MHNTTHELYSDEADYVVKSMNESFSQLNVSEQEEGFPTAPGAVFKFLILSHQQ